MEPVGLILIIIYLDEPVFPVLQSQCLWNGEIVELK